MAEALKSNVEGRERAYALLGQIHAAFPGFRANFDLEDRDNILRVEYERGDINPQAIMDILNGLGHRAPVLADGRQAQCSLSQLPCQYAAFTHRNIQFGALYLL